MKIIKFLILVFIFLKSLNTQNQIFLTLNNEGNHLLFCDDIIDGFNTSNINIFKLLEDYKINIKQNISINKTDNDICTRGIYYFIDSEYEEILIEFNIFPKNLHNLFRQSNMSSIKIITNLQMDNSNEISDFSNMFQDCINLTSIDLSKYNFCNVGKFNSMFSGCIKLNYFSLPQNLSINCINFENADFSEMFSDCSSLTSIDLSGISFNGINNINNIFSNCNNIESIKLKGSLNFPFFINLNTIYINIFPKTNSLRHLNLFDMDMNLSFIDLTNLNSLEECLYYEQYSNTKKCKKYIGFHNCGECLNDNKEYYCIKNIEGINYTFYYLEEQINLSVENRECFWSENYNNFLIYKFKKNGENEISYYSYNYDSCEKYINGTQCIKCNNEKGFYKIENEEYYCTNAAPADNYILDYEAKEWRQCNKRCKKCHLQSRSEIDHQCLFCSQYFYPFKIDYENYENKLLTGYSCFTYGEVKSKYLNYYLNSNNQFEKCDISCKECEKENKCIACNDNYYYIYEHENGTCFHYPLAHYGLVNINDQSYFKPCFYLCKYCNFITISLLYQQCSKCDEIDYTLDLFSLNQSLCIPKDKSNSYFIKEKTKWYIENLTDISGLEIKNKDLVIDYEKLLNIEKYNNNNMKYIIVENCPDDRPFIIYSIRQCVSSCNSSNLIENGLFMTKQLYLYNNICYDRCPYGSIEDNINHTCIEINQYTSINSSLTPKLFKKNTNNYILTYLSEYANNSVDIMRAHDFSNYFYNHNTNYSYKLQLQLPIFDFKECIEKMKIHFKLFNNNIFYAIIEYNDQTNKNGKINKNSNLINYTEFQFFLENGTILDYSICQGINITTEKRVEVNKININSLKEIEDNYNISLFNHENKEFNDYCIPFSIGKKDLTLYDRLLLIQKYKPPCDEGCSFNSFNYETNYSTCICPIKIEDDKKIIDKIVEEINEINYIKLLKDSNFKYFFCPKTIKSLFNLSIIKLNWISIISFLFTFLNIFFIIYACCNDSEMEKKSNEGPKNEEPNGDKMQNEYENNDKDDKDKDKDDEDDDKEENGEQNANIITNENNRDYREDSKQNNNKIETNNEYISNEISSNRKDNSDRLELILKQNNKNKKKIKKNTKKNLNESENNNNSHLISVTTANKDNNSCIISNKLNMIKIDNETIHKKSDKTQAYSENIDSNTNNHSNNINKNISNTINNEDSENISNSFNSNKNEENNNNSQNNENINNTNNINNHSNNNNKDFNNINNNEEKNSSILTINEKVKNMKCRSFFCKYCKNYAFNFIESEKKNKCVINTIIFFIFLHTLIFLNAIFFSDKNISEMNAYKNTKIEYIITKEYDRIIYTIFIGSCFFRWFHWLFKEQEYLKCINKCKFISGLIIIMIFHLSFLYFLLIFTTINIHNQVPLIISSSISLGCYLFLYLIISIIISFFKYISNIKNKNGILSKLSKCIKNLF